MVAVMVRVLIAAVVFLAVCAIIDQTREQPIKMITGERAGGFLAICIAVAIDSFRTKNSRQ